MNKYDCKPIELKPIPRLFCVYKRKIYFIIFESLISHISNKIIYKFKSYKSLK